MILGGQLQQRLAKDAIGEQLRVISTQGVSSNTDTTAVVPDLSPMDTDLCTARFCTQDVPKCPRKIRRSSSESARGEDVCKVE